MREIRTYGSEGGGAARSPYPYQFELWQTREASALDGVPAFAGTTVGHRYRRRCHHLKPYLLSSDIFTGRPSWADRSAAKTTRWLSNAVSKLVRGIGSFLPMLSMKAWNCG